MRQNFFATYRIEIYMNKSHFLYVTPSVLKCHWNRSLPCQYYQMLCILEMRETQLIFHQSPRCTCDIWEKVAQEEQLGKINIWGRNK